MKNVGVLKHSLVVESLLDILTKRRNQAFYKLIDVHSLTNVLCGSISVVSMWNIISKVSMSFTFELLVNNLREKNFFPAQMNRNRFDLVLARSYWNSSTMENLRYLNSVVSAVNELILLQQFGEHESRQSRNSVRNTQTLNVG